MSMATLSLTLPNGLSYATTTELLSGCQFNTNGKLNKARMTRSVKPLHVAKLSTRVRRSAAAQPTVQNKEDEEEDEDPVMSTEALHQYIDLSLGFWNGSFYQYDALGNVTQCVNTKLSVTSYGEEDLVSLMQTLKIKQPPSKIATLDTNDPEWEEFKLRETNMFTVDTHQQIGFFPEEKAFSLRHQTAEMLDRVLRVGVLGEDDTDEEFPKNLKVPPRRPSIVCESCLYSMEGNSRMRAFHVLNHRGLIDMIGVFHESREKEMTSSSAFDKYENNEERINALLGRWSGHSVTKRSGFYGTTIAEADIDLMLERDENGQLIQEINSTSGGGTSVRWNGTAQDGLVTFDGGFQMTLLPGGMYLASPTSVAKSVAETQSFFLEFSWMESPGKRRRLVRTFDVQGVVVSTTYINETKL